MASKFKIIKKTHGLAPHSSEDRPIITPSSTIMPSSSTNIMNPKKGQVNNPVIAYINAIKMDPETANETIEQLETYKHSEEDAFILDKINVILAELKQFVAEISITKSECQKTKIIDEFKKKYKKLSDNDFVKRIDLTAPKKDRKPDINTTIWKTSKDNVYSNPSYSSYTPAQLSSFKTAFRKKKLSIPGELRDKINENIEGNYTKLAIHKYEPERLIPKTYTPERFAGLSIY
jgi:hypothetical protein